MMTQEPAAPHGPGPQGSDAPGGGIGDDDERLAPLRGAGVDVDTRRAAQAVIAVSLAGLAVLTVVLFVAGFQKNAQQSSLAARGVPVTVTVTSCLAEMGGSGSNQAGYACTGTYTVDGRRYTESIPGNDLHTAGSTVRGVTVPGDPALLSTPDIVRAQHASWTVFIAPTALLVVLVGFAVLLLARRRSAAAGAHRSAR